MRLGVAAALVGGDLVDGDVEVIDGRVAAVGLGAPSGSRIAAPGFVDLQVNGFAGVDFSAPGEDGYALAGAALLAGGSPPSSRRSSPPTSTRCESRSARSASGSVGSVKSVAAPLRHRK